MTRHSASLFAYARTIRQHRDLLAQLVRRDFKTKFAGSFLGAVWAVLTPLLTVMIFTFVFGVVFQTRWGGEPTTKGDFAIIFLLGMLIHAVFAESIARGPTIILGNPSYVKRVVFPLEILPVSIVLQAVITGIIGLAVVILANVLLTGTLQPTIFFLPLLLVPYMLMVLGVTLFFSSIGVYIRDLGQIVSFLTTITLFATPIFYPMDAVPAPYRPLIYLNPLTFTVEQARAVTLFGNTPNLYGLGFYSLLSIVVVWAGFAWFQKSRSGFADVT